MLILALRGRVSQQTLNQCWFNVGPASQTVDQHETNIGSIGPFEWLFSSSTFFFVKKVKVIQQKFDGEFFRLVSLTTGKNQTANRVRYNKT